MGIIEVINGVLAIIGLLLLIRILGDDNSKGPGHRE